MLSKIRELLSPFMSFEAAKFLFAGGAASLINWLVRFPLSTLMPLSVSVACAYIIGMFAGFWLYRQWVFKRSSLPLRTEIIRFCGVNIIGLLVATAMTSALVALAEHMGFNMQASVVGVCHALAIATGAVANFLGHKFLTFARN